MDWGRSKERYVTVRDAAGKRHDVLRQQFEEHLLHEILFDAYNKPAELRALIIRGLQDGFAARLDDAARRYCQVASDPVEGILLRAHVLAEAGEQDRAEAVLAEFEEAQGFNPRTHGFLAELTYEQGKLSEALAMLKRVLAVEPNLMPAVGSYQQISFEKGGEEARKQALSEIAKAEGAWLPQVWLAGVQLNAGQRGEAMEGFVRYIDQIGADQDVLGLVAGSLAGARQSRMVVELIWPRFDVDKGSPDAALAILVSLLDMGREVQARDFLSLLWNRWPPHMREHLQEIYDAVYRVPWYKRWWRRLKGIRTR